MYIVRRSWKVDVLNHVSQGAWIGAGVGGTWYNSFCLSFVADNDDDYDIGLPVDADDDDDCHDASPVDAVIAELLEPDEAVAVSVNGVEHCSDELLNVCFNNFKTLTLNN